MSEIKLSVAPVVIVLFDADSRSPVTLRVKPDRRQIQMLFPPSFERRVATAAPRLSENAVVPSRSTSDAVR
jgi:hypothetical protein